MMKPDFLVTLVSLIISGTLATLQIKSWLQDKDSAEKAAILSASHADQDRDGIIVGSAERAVGILKQTLDRVSADAEALRIQLKETQAELQSTRDQLAYARAEVEDLRAEVHAARQWQQERNNQHPTEGVGP